jgi:hypothetical protein
MSVNGVAFPSILHKIQDLVSRNIKNFNLFKLFQEKIVKYSHIENNISVLY